MFDMFGPRMPRQPIRPPCTNWYGHRFVETKDGTSIYCTHCGDVRRIEGDPGDR